MVSLADRDYMRSNYNNKSSGYYKIKNIFRKAKRNLFFLTIIWIIFVLFALPILETLVSSIIDPLGFIFILISLILGFYLSYRFVMWIDRKLPNTEFGLWSRRGIASLLILVGLGFAIIFLFSFTMTMTQLPRGTSSSIFVSFSSLGALIICFLIGLAVFAGYMEFTFERRAGIIVFHGRQRF